VSKSIHDIWPELDWIEDVPLREKTARVWEYAIEQSPLTAEDLEEIPFTLLTKRAVSFMAHKRSVVHVCRDSANTMREFYGDTIPIDMDVLISGAILIDVGKLLEYEKDASGKVVQSNYGSLLRHPFSGVGLAMRFDLPPEVCHMIAMHAKEGDTGQRTTEGLIAHHADFMTFEPFKLLK
jgi:hypothetical protein